MNERLLTTLEIIIGGLIAITPGILAWVSSVKTQRRQDEVEAAKEKMDSLRLPIELKSAAGQAADSVASAYDKLVEDMQLRINKMEDRQELSDKRMDAQDEKIAAQDIIIVAQGKRITYLEGGVRQLVGQVKELGGTPVFDVNGEKKD